MKVEILDFLNKNISKSLNRKANIFSLEKPLVKTSIQPRSGVARVCGVSWWFVVFCGGLWFLWCLVPPLARVVQQVKRFIQNLFLDETNIAMCGRKNKNIRTDVLLYFLSTFSKIWCGGFVNQLI